jgi:succinate dehydrogenase/fumarate reductase flavoprotein subunit
MLENLGRVVDTDVLVIGGGAGGLWSALSAKRTWPLGRVTLVDAHMVGRSGHAAFSNAWMAVVTPDDDFDKCLEDIIQGNEWIAEQELIRDILARSYEQLLALEKMGLSYPKKDGKFVRRPTRGLRFVKVLKPEGGGLEFCWKMRQAAEREGVRIIERIFITGLIRDEAGQAAGAVGIDGRTGEFTILRAKATVVATNSVTFRSGFVRDLTGTGPVIAYRAGATLTNAEFGYLRPGTPKFYFEGITYAIQDGAKFRNAADETFMEKYDSEWADRADVHAISKAMLMERKTGNTPLYLDMSMIPNEKRGDYLRSTVAWMDYFYKKLGDRARIDMFGKTEYYPIYQMTKLGIKTDAQCASSIAGLFAAGLAQVACATHFAEFHIAVCNGTGWIAGRSSARFAQRAAAPAVSESLLASLKKDIGDSFGPESKTNDDDLLLELQKIVFSSDVTMLKTEARLDAALDQVQAIREKCLMVKAPSVHGFVRLNETDCMIDTAELILRASRLRRESRLSHIREDYPDRDDDNWLRWVLIKEQNRRTHLWTEPIATPLIAIKRTTDPARGLS